VLADNSVVNAVQLAQTMQGVASSTPGFISLVGQTDLFGGALTIIDLCVAVLDLDMDAEGAHVVPIPAVRSRAESDAIFQPGTPLFAVSQGAGRSTNSTPPVPISDYPRTHKAMHYVRQLGQTAVSPYDAVDYQVWDGDSGTPTFLLHRGVVYLDRILTHSPWGGWRVGAYVPQLNQMIAAADAGAIALGRLTEPTGLTVTAVTLPAD
jgi:hypothetical protein